MRLIILLDLIDLNWAMNYQLQCRLFKKKKHGNQKTMLISWREMDCFARFDHANFDPISLQSIKTTNFCIYCSEFQFQLKLKLPEGYPVCVVSFIVRSYCCLERNEGHLEDSNLSFLPGKSLEVQIPLRVPKAPGLQGSTV